MQCPVQLDIGTDYGDYLSTYTPYANCSIIGVFVNPNPIYIYIGYGRT